MAQVIKINIVLLRRYDNLFLKNKQKYATDLTTTDCKKNTIHICQQYLKTEQ